MQYFKLIKKVFIINNSRHFALQKLYAGASSQMRFHISELRVCFL